MKEELRIRIPKELKEKAETRAAEMNVSLSAFIRWILTETLDKK